MRRPRLEVIVGGIIAISLLCLLVLAASVFVINSNQGRPREVNTASPNPVTEASITLAPDSGYSGTQVTVTGRTGGRAMWSSFGCRAASGEIDENYAYAGAVVDDQGEFKTSLNYPYEERWLKGDQVKVVARAEASGVQATAPFKLVAPRRSPCSRRSPRCRLLRRRRPRCPAPSPASCATSRPASRSPGAEVTVGTKTVKADAQGRYSISEQCRLGRTLSRPPRPATTRPSRR